MTYKNIYVVNIPVLGETHTFDLETLPTQSAEFIIQYGFRRWLNDKMAGKANPASLAEAKKIVDDAIVKLNNGTLSIVTRSKTDEREKLGTEYIANALKTKGFAVSKTKKSIEEAGGWRAFAEKSWGEKSQALVLKIETYIEETMNKTFDFDLPSM